MEKSLEEIRKLWEEQPDEYISKELEKNKRSYPPEIQHIIVEVAEQKGLIDRDRAQFLQDVIAKEYTSDKIITKEEKVKPIAWNIFAFGAVMLVFMLVGIKLSPLQCGGIGICTVGIIEAIRGIWRLSNTTAQYGLKKFGCLCR